MVAAGVACAQDQKVTLFSGSLDAVSLGSWGSGTIEIDEDQQYLNNDALTINTGGFFSGGRLDLKQPLEVAGFVSDPAGGYLRLVVKVPEPTAVTIEAPGGMLPPGFEDFPMGPGEGPGFMGPRGPGFFEEPLDDPHGDHFEMGMEDQMQPLTPPAPPEKIERLRVLVVTDVGAIDSGPIVLEEYSQVVDDWKQVVIPLSDFAGSVDISEGQITQIALFGNTEEKFHLGEISLGYEQQPLLADAGESKTVRANEVARFEAAPQPEGVSAQYVWDFDHLDGIQEEGYGPETTWTFATPGYYVVTLTVSDPQGRKVDRIDRVHVRVVE